LLFKGREGGFSSSEREIRRDWMISVNHPDFDVTRNPCLRDDERFRERNPRFVMELMEPREVLEKRATKNAKFDVIIIWSAVCNFMVSRQAVFVSGR